MPKHILVVEDETEIQNILKAFLEEDGYIVDTACDGVDGMTAFHNGNYDLILLDIMLPKVNGFAVCEMIRKESDVPIVMLTALDDEDDQIKGFDLKVDDYITKPFSPKEVAYRVKAQLRRAGYQTQDTITNIVEKTLQIGPFQLNADETEVHKNGVLLELTAKEIGLMACFMHNPNRILSKETLFERVWGEDFFGSDNTVMVHIRRLREKIEQDASNPLYITTVKGLGYKFVMPKEAQE